MTSTSVSGGAPFWWTTAWNYFGRCTMQTDGNFACYNRQNAIVWSTGTSGKGVGPNYYLAVQNNKKIVLYDSKNTLLWST